MKKALPLILILICLLSNYVGKSQNTACNSNFNAVPVGNSGMTFHFQPAFIGDTLFTSHTWSFGNGAVSILPSPVHTYTAPGIYNVKHVVTRYTPNGALLCKDSVTQVLTVAASCNAAFTHTSQGLTTAFASAMQAPNVQHQWNFGNGTTSTLANPVVTYATGGSYVVKHVVRILASNASLLCADSVTQTITVSNVICNIQANFTFVRDAVNPRKFHFTNTTTNFAATDSISWTFEPTVPTVHGVVNPTHTFGPMSTYLVCLRIKRNMPPGTPPCISEICKPVVVDTVGIANCNANFVINQQANVVTVVPAMQTANAQHHWNFGNGLTSTQVSPTVTYTQPGTYAITHRVKLVNNAGAIICQDSMIKWVQIVMPCNLQANFTFTRDAINKKKFYFTNTTTNLSPNDSTRWLFGDGSPAVYSTNAIHTFANYGVYNVCLRVQRPSPIAAVPCVSEKCIMIIVDSAGIVPSACLQYNVDFNMVRDTSNPRKIHFINTSTQAPNAIATWSFGDGTTATGWNVTHTYPTIGGAYYPCLKVTYSNICFKTKCKVIQFPSATACVLQPYPNPANNVVNAQVSLTQPAVIYTKVLNMQNIVMRQQQQNGTVGVNTVTVNVATLPLGMYKIRIQHGNKICQGVFMKN